jgi:hypothetical protein
MLLVDPVLHDAGQLAQRVRERGEVAAMLRCASGSMARGGVMPSMATAIEVREASVTESGRRASR